MLPYRYHKPISFGLLLLLLPCLLVLAPIAFCFLDLALFASLLFWPTEKFARWSVSPDGLELRQSWWRLRIPLERITEVRTEDHHLVVVCWEGQEIAEYKVTAKDRFTLLDELTDNFDRYLKTPNGLVQA